MIAIYVHEARPECFDRARALIEALPGAILVSAHPPRLGWATDWRLLPDSDAGTWTTWLRETSPDLVIVDGPATHARAVTDLGATLLVVANPGDGDRGSAYADAAAILAPWPEAVLDWPDPWRERTIHLGAIGWRADQERRRSTVSRPGAVLSAVRQCVALWPTSGGPGPRERREIGIETPGWRWTYALESELREPGPIWSALARAEAAVCAPTLMNLAALARFGVPGVLVVPEKPSPAVTVLADLAARSAPVVVVRRWPTPDDWGGLLDEARALDPQQWSAWDPTPGLADLGAVTAGGAAATELLAPA